jgi:hypothetical protein
LQLPLSGSFGRSIERCDMLDDIVEAEKKQSRGLGQLTERRAARTDDAPLKNTLWYIGRGSTSQLCGQIMEQIQLSLLCQSLAGSSRSRNRPGSVSSSCYPTMREVLFLKKHAVSSDSKIRPQHLSNSSPITNLKHADENQVEWQLRVLDEAFHVNFHPLIALRSFCVPKGNRNRLANQQTLQCRPQCTAVILVLRPIPYFTPDLSVG